MRLSRKGIANIRRGLVRSWQDGAHRQRQLERGANADVDTLRKRALHDRRGSLYARVTVPTECGERTFALLWSVRGRTDQVDIISDGAILATIRPGAALSEIERINRG